MKFNTSITLLLVSALCHNIFAQQQADLSPTELKQQTIVTEPQTLYKGFFRGGLAINYLTVDKFFSSSGERKSLESNIWTNSWYFQPFLLYGISDRLQVEAKIAYKSEVTYQSVNIEAEILNQIEILAWQIKSQGIGDLSLTVGYQIFPETEKRPSITGYLGATLPTGEKNPTNIRNEREYDKPVGSGEPAAQLELRMRKAMFPFVYSLSASYEVHFGGEKINSEDILDPNEYPFKWGNVFDVNAYFIIHLNDWIAVRNSFFYQFFSKDEFDGIKAEQTAWTFIYYPLLSFQVKNFRIDQAVSVPLWGKLTSADPVYFVVLGYTF